MIILAPNLRTVADNDGAVILDIEHNAMTPVDATGGFVWQRLLKGLQLKEIVAELVLESGAPESLIHEDVSDFVKTLESRHLLTISSEPGTDTRDSL